MSTRKRPEWTFFSAFRRVSEAGCKDASITLLATGQQIKRLVVKPCPQVGIHTWGAIDYLRRVHRYAIMLDHGRPARARELEYA